MKRRFEFVGGSSAKFYEICIEGQHVITCYGRIGSDGQSQTKSFEDAEGAANHAQQLIRQKLGKGYTECQVTQGT